MFGGGRFGVRPTRRWRKTDSNHRSLSGRIPLFRLVLPAGGVEEACSEKPPVLRGDRQFESVFLRRPVCLTSAFHAYRRKDPAFAGSVSLDETRERDLLAMSWLAVVDFL